MPRTVSPGNKKPKQNGEAGFSLTELIAGLLVASLLIGGLVDIIRRYARTTDTVRTTAAELRTSHILEAVFHDVERIDPGSLSVSRDRIGGSIGNQPLKGDIVTDTKLTLLRWSSSTVERSIVVPSGARFEQLPSGALALLIDSSATPLAVAFPRRTIPFDCQFDTVTRECRQ